MITTCITEHCISAPSGLYYIEAKSNSVGKCSCMWVKVKMGPMLDKDPFGRWWFRGIPVTIRDAK